MDCEFIGGRIVKDLTRGGRGWKWIWDPLPGTDLGVDTDETLFMVYGSTTPDGGAYATFADVLAAVQAGLDLSALGTALEAELDDNYWIKGGGYTDCYGTAIGNGSTSVIDLTNCKLTTGAGSPAAWTCTPRLIVESTQDATGTDGALKVDGGALITKKLRTLDVTEATSTDGALIVGGGALIGKKAYIAGTTDATSTDGALHVVGGALIDKKVYVADTTAASYSSGPLGAVVIKGGFHVQEESWLYDGSSSVLAKFLPGGTWAAEIQGHVALVKIGGNSSNDWAIKATGTGSRELQICNDTYALEIMAGDANIATGGVLRVADTQVVGAQGAAVADATGGATVDAEARTAINDLLARLRTHGLIAT
jgi:hypothetical protein